MPRFGKLIAQLDDLCIVVWIAVIIIYIQIAEKYSIAMCYHLGRVP